MIEAEKETRKAYSDFHALNPDWAWKFTLLRARILHRRGLDEEVLRVLSAEPASPPSHEIELQKLRWEGLAEVSLHKFVEAEKAFSGAEIICAASNYPECISIIYGRGTLEMERGNYALGERFFERVLESARASGDPSRVANAMLDLSWAANKQEHFDQALDWADASRRISMLHAFGSVAETALGNMGWAYYKLGDPEKAEGMFREARAQAEALGDVSDQARWLQAMGYVYLDAHKFDQATTSYMKSLELARQTKNREHLVNSLIALAFVSEQAGKTIDAKTYAADALAKSREAQDARDVIYSRLVQGRIAVRETNDSVAEEAFREVAESADAPIFLKWEAERSLAHLFEDENQPANADLEYRTALHTFENARSELRHETSRLPFLTNATRIYDDYIHFLISQNKPTEALQVAEYSRARTLSEGLGISSKAPPIKDNALVPPAVNAQAISRRAGGTILFYWLGEKQSYLWAITPQRMQLFPLAPASEIDSAVRSYRAKIEGPPEILEASSDSSALYEMLLAPAHDFLAKTISPQNNRVFIIPDGSLNTLNFETLTPAPNHYWIEDVTLSSAGSLRLLEAAHAPPRKLAGKLLLIGDPVAPTSNADNAYPALPKAQEEMRNIEQHFAPAQETILAHERATPSAVLNNHPEQFSYIHFVSHGEASRTSPLDSAIILSRDPAAVADDDSFKLYARDIIQHPLHAELVTISACYGAGNRSYSGEGLVGLAWGFLRAGAHNVVGALWDASDDSLPQLMDVFYGEMQKGKIPSAALRTAKLSLLHSDNAAFRRPFHWGTFQLYTGS